MKQISTRLTKVLAFAVALLLSEQAYAHAGQKQITSTQAQKLSGDLAQTDSQDFFRQGQSRLEQEIQLLRQRQLTATQPLLSLDQAMPGEKDHSPGNSHKPSLNQ